MPVFRYETTDITTTADVNEAYDRIKAADAANYLMALATSGSGNDQVTNSCGIAKSHAYSLIAAFTMTDAAGTDHKCLLIRNPWGVSYYSGTWYKNDASWTNALVAQVPFGVDVRSEQQSKGLFVMPVADLPTCFESYQIAHLRESEGYIDTWYDKEDDTDLTTEGYFFRLDPDVDSDIYVFAETYAHNIIPIQCTATDNPYGTSYFWPQVDIAVYQGLNRIGTNTYFEQFHQPTLLSSKDHRAFNHISIYATFQYYGSPAPDYTIKVYSKYTGQIMNVTMQSNQIHMDGQSPSGFTGSDYDGYSTCNPKPKSTEERDLSKVNVKSMTDLLSKA